MAKVLYLEDETWTVEGSVKRVLEIEFKHEIIVCQDIETADARLRSEIWDVLVADIMLDADQPVAFERSAFQLIERIRCDEYQEFGNPKSLPIVLASGVWEMMIRWKDGEHITVQEALQRSGIGQELRVEKPYLTSELDSTIQQALEMEVRDE